MILRRLTPLIALAVVYACVPSSPGENSSDGGASSGSSGSSSSGSTEEDAAVFTDASHSTDATSVSDGSDGADAAATDASVLDAAPDVSIDAAADAGTCECVSGYVSGKPYSFPGGEACLGGCTFVAASLSGPYYYNDYRSSCRLNCNAACAPDPPYGGVCPPECTGGCADGSCNILCDGSDPSKTCTGDPGSAGEWLITKPIVKCPAGMPCRVTCRNNACSHNIIACPRDQASCEIDCGFGVDKGCSGTHFYCGTGRCKVAGQVEGIGESGKGGFPEYNMFADVCGHACSCELPVPAVFHNGAGTRCLCKDGLIHGFPAPPGEDKCPAFCAAYGGWSVPWERTPGSL